MDLGSYEMTFRSLMRRRSILEFVIRIALLPFSLIFRVFKHIVLIFDRRRERIKTNIPVISVGNIALGGVGKTPVVFHIADFLIEKGVKPLVVISGYGGRNRVEPLLLKGGDKKHEHLSDEGMLYLNNLSNFVLGVGRRREEVINASSEYRPDIAILDDGLQYRRVQKDLEMVVLDGENPIPQLFPAGKGRDVGTAVEKGDAIILTRRGRCIHFDKHRERLKSHYDIPVFEMTYQPLYLYNPVNTERKDLDDLNDIKIFLFSVIPSLKTIEEELKMKGLYVQRREYPDHHHYSRRDIEFIEWMAQRFDLIITTEKDYMNLKDYDITMPFYILKSEVRIEPTDEFQSLLMGIIED